MTSASAEQLYDLERQVRALAEEVDEARRIIPALQYRLERAVAFIDYTVREFLAYNEHAQCEPAKCKHRQILDEQYTAIETMLAEIKGDKA